MLNAIVLCLRPVEPARLPIWHGRFVHAAALKLLEQLDSELAKELHNSHGMKPFTASPLAGNKPAADQDFLLTPDQGYTWRLTGLAPQVSQHLSHIARKGSEIRIGQVLMIVEAIQTGGSELEARRDSYEALLERWQKRRVLRRITLEVLTPATFKKHRHDQPFPVPRLVFGSLLKTWNAFAPCPLGDLTDLIDESIMLGEWNGAAYKVCLNNQASPRGESRQYRRTGFTGTFTYWVANPESPAGMIMGLLAEYAFFAGIGSLTAQGMGQVRPQFPRLGTSG